MMRWLLLALSVLALAAGCTSAGIGGPVLRDCTSTVSSSSAGTFQQAARDANECNAENARRMQAWTSGQTAQAYGVTATARAVAATMTARALPTMTATATATATATPMPTATSAPTPEPTLTALPTMTATATATATPLPAQAAQAGGINWAGLAALVIGALVLLIGIGLMGRWIARRIDG